MTCMRENSLIEKQIKESPQTHEGLAMVAQFACNHSSWNRDKFESLAGA